MLKDYSADVYSHLISLWHAMAPLEKRLVMKIVERNGGYTPDACTSSTWKRTCPSRIYKSFGFKFRRP
jgi:hypothetical protein